MCIKLTPFHNSRPHCPHHHLIFIDFFALLLLNCHPWGETCCPLFQRFLEVLPFPRVMSAFWPPFSKVSGFQGSCQLFGTLFSKVSQGSCQLFGAHFSKVSGSASFSKGHVSFLAPFFQRFLEALPFPRVMSTFCTFFERFLDVLPFPRVMSILPEVDSDKSPLLQRFASTWFSKIPFSKVLFQSVPLFQRYLEVFLIPHGPFSKG